MTIEQIAEHLGVDVRHVRHLVVQRRIPFFKWSRRLRFDPAEVAAWLHDAHVDPLVRRDHLGRR